MKKYLLLGALLITTITLSAQQRPPIPQTGARIAEHQTFQTAVREESALLEELYMAEEMAAFDLGPAPERARPEKVAEVRETSTSDMKNTTKASQSRQRKTLPFSPLMPGQRSTQVLIRSNHFQAPGLLSTIPKLFLSFPRIFRMTGR